MKPLPVAPLTDEDRDIRGELLMRLFRREGNNFKAACQRVDCRPQDRRDAALMLELVALRSIGAYGDVRMLQEMAGQDGCSCGGWMGHYRWVSPKWSDGRYITYCA